MQALHTPRDPYQQTWPWATAMKLPLNNSAGTLDFWGQKPTVLPFAWQNNKVFFSLHLKLCLWDLIQHWCTEIVFSIKDTEVSAKCCKGLRDYLMQWRKAQRLRRMWCAQGNRRKSESGFRPASWFSAYRSLYHRLHTEKIRNLGAVHLSLGGYKAPRKPSLTVQGHSPVPTFIFIRGATIISSWLGGKLSV